jgi:hypothetical protein
MKKKISKPKKPMLASDDYDQVERRVDKMLRTEDSQSMPTEESVASSTDVVPSAPAVPTGEKPLKITIMRDGDGEQRDDIPDIVEINKDIERQVASRRNQGGDTGASAESLRSADLDSQESSLTEDMIEAPATDAAVSDIVAHEGDELLLVEDAKSQHAEKVAHPSRWTKCRRWLASWWTDGGRRRRLLLSGLALLVVAFVIPTSRYVLLNTVGVRGSLSIVIIDDSTRQPLRNVTVRIDDNTVATDETGQAKLDRVKLGRQQLHIERRAFADRQLGVTVGWGSNPLGEYRLVPTGSQYLFRLTDYVSGAAIAGAEVISGDASTFSDEEGLARLTIDAEDDAPELDVSYVADGYREDRVRIDANIADHGEVRLVPYLSHFFVSQRSGRYETYRIDADGQNEEIVLPATGAERPDMVLVPHPSKQRVAVVSTRDNVRNQDGFLLSSLTIVDIDDEQTIKVAESERVQVVGWFDNRIVFVQIAEGASGANPKRHRVMSYDYDNDATQELAASNYFSSVMAVGDMIYVAPASIFQESPAQLYRIRADGSNKEVVFEGESWGIYRLSYSAIAIVTSSRWLRYELAGGELSLLDQDPQTLQNRLYTESPSGDRSARIEERDGKGVLLMRTDNEPVEAPRFEQGGLGYPLRWLNDSVIVYRVNTASETADYALSITGGEPVKLRDVTATPDWTAGIDIRCEGLRR